MTRPFPPSQPNPIRTPGTTDTIRDVVGRFIADRQTELGKHAGKLANQKQFLRLGNVKPISRVRARGR